MSNALRTIEFLCLGVWLGGVCLLSFVVAPGAFSILGNRDMAGRMVAYTLGRAHFIGIGAGVIYLVANFLHASFASQHRPPRRYRRDNNVAAHSVLSVLRDVPSRRFANANGLS